MISRSVVYHVDTEKEADMSAEALTWLYRQVLNQESNIPCIQICLGTHKEVEIYIHEKAELLEIYAKLVKTINGDDVVYLTNIQKFVDGHGATYISGTVAEPDLSDFEDDFHGNFSEFLTRCFKDRIDWYRISQNEELGKFPHGGVFGEKLELIV